MTNYGSVRREDVEVIYRGMGDKWTVILVHDPTGVRVEATDVTALLAREQAWIRLRDKLENLG